MSDNRLKIGITQGDTNGIGWEVILKTLSDSRMTELCTPVVYGTPAAAEFYRSRIAELEEIAFNTVVSARDARRGRVNLVACGPQQLRIAPGEPSAEAGQAAVEALRTAMRDLKEGTLDALVTGPIDKETVQADDFRHTGHTEYLAAELGGTPMMLMCSDLLRVGLVTTHLPLAEVSAALSRERITAAIERLARSLVADFGVVKPRIAVLALNPHAGDGGLLGDEEEQTIRPAVNDAYAAGILAFGPFAADGFFASGNYARYDAVLAMYHDQGLAPFKTLTPDGVNCTAGLGKVRTSPDHGVAYDIAGKDKADPQSMRNAIYAAIDIVGNRRRWAAMSAAPLQRFERDRGRDASAKDLPEAKHD
ncbi:4-hydroxythreonine-4-phosphate dehydrogenase PdxA [Alistipes sp.]|uniref:4-hydroxythreonine-4-phosphate dehydrogenase PdxA n=1 Tax=Alistipes sp. TaxID=1872444 RepID=UPI003A8B059F